MLNIRVHQVIQLSKAAEEQLSVRLAGDIAAEAKREGHGQPSAEQLLPFVRQAISSAKGYGLTWESSFAAYAKLSYVLGPKFDQSPMFQERLAGDKARADRRMCEFLTSMNFGDWDRLYVFTGNSPSARP